MVITLGASNNIRLYRHIRLYGGSAVLVISGGNAMNNIFKDVFYDTF